MTRCSYKNCGKVKAHVSRRKDLEKIFFLQNSNVIKIVADMHITHFRCHNYSMTMAHLGSYRPRSLQLYIKLLCGLRVLGGRLLVARPWVSIYMSSTLTHMIYILPFLSCLAGSKSVSAGPSAHLTQIP